MSTNRRQFLQRMGSIAAGVAALSVSGMDAFASGAPKKLFFKISLAQWSLHKALFSNKMNTLDFPGMARNTFGIDTVEYVSQFFQDKAKDHEFLRQLLARSKDNGVTNHLLMVDQEGELCTPDQKKRAEAIEGHYKWVDAARYLGCKSVRVNAFGSGSREDVKAAAVDGLEKLGEYAAKAGITLLAENHGGYSSDAAWLADVIKQVNSKNVGTLADFTNFCIKREGPGFWEGKCLDSYDPYKGVSELMPYAKGVSAKTFEFDAQGNCVETDYPRMLKIIKEAGFKGYLGIEYEGDSLPEEEGIRKTKALLERVGQAFS
ncbi:sugar phosphate isomerase/epimerase [Pontibacter sp. SGAir0037]|uniref:sugar phosphate isomerase/epimerase family protein n=1 Tax=Pontibacter sp. SGAir0037 TaxID=2571030 RepID=UPI0010CD2D65|nr:sugar phosphate isomerase/epimerase family protein [Pontibacter sp. SGAir0037]QCR22241.1 xylose isomerase [Pontibacter sp. SGAir0037]